MTEFSSRSGSSRTRKPKHKIISSVLTLAAAISLLTGCNSPDIYSSDYGYSDRSYEYSYSSTSSAVSTSDQPESTVSSSTESTTSSTKSSTSSGSSAPKSTFSSSTRSSSTYSVKPAQSEAPSVGTPHRTKLLDTKSEEFVAYTTGCSELNFSSYYTPYLFDFRTSMTVGYSIHDVNNQLPVEADYGVMGRFNGSVISIKTYDYTGRDLSVVSSYIESLDTSYSKESAPFGPVAMKNDASALANGLYRISVTFSNGNTAKLYFLVNGDEYQFCQMTMASKTAIDPNYNINMIRARRANVHELLDEWNVTPQNSLSVDIIKYPCPDRYDANGKMIWRCDTDLWARFSDELVDPTWSDERKAYVICDWMSQNLAYDNYVSDVLGEDRQVHYIDSTGKYSAWELKCGVCRDFGQILTIMLRQQGIPAEVIANDTHLWNVVYLNGQWMEVDISRSMTKYVDGLDTNARRTSGNSYSNLLNMLGQNNDNYRGTSLHKFLYMGQSFD